MAEIELQESWFTATDGRQIFFRSQVPTEPRGILLIAHGYAEHSGRYQHLMQHFSSKGFAVYAEDHRGHGRSARVLGDIESFDAVVADMAVLHRRALTQCPGLPVFLLGHSMGGLICTLYAERTDGLAGAILNGAAMDIPDDTSPWLLRAAAILARITPTLPVEPFYEPETLSSDPAIVAAVEADPLFYKGKLRARTGDQLIRNIRAAVRDLVHLTLPIFVTHGTEDKTVPLRASEILFGGAASKDKTLHLFEGLLHEVHNEPTRDEVLATWTSWLEARL